MAIRQARYLAYMLRLWQIDDAGRPVWRASLESAHDNERLGFGDLEALFAFLENKTRQDAPPADEPTSEVQETERTGT